MDKSVTRTLAGKKKSCPVSGKAKRALPIKSGIFPKDRKIIAEIVSNAIG